MDGTVTHYMHRQVCINVCMHVIMHMCCDSNFMHVLFLITVPGGQPQLVDSIRRHEVDTVINNQNALLMLAREIR